MKYEIKAAVHHRQHFCCKEAINSLRRDFDCEFKMVTWLDCESTVEGGAKVIMKLKCTVCHKFCSSILFMRNFSNKWITGVDSICTSNIQDHATSEQHSHAMTMLSREQAMASGCSVMALWH